MRHRMRTLILSPKILLIENDSGAADGIRAALAATGSGSFDVEWVRQLSEGLERLSKRGINAVLLELSLPDSQRSEEHTSELQSHLNLVCRLLLEKKKINRGLSC